MSNPHPEAKEVQFSINLTENALIHTFMMEVRAYLKGAKQKSEKICLAFYLHAQETLSLEYSKLIRKTFYTILYTGNTTRSGKEEWQYTATKPLSHSVLRAGGSKACG